MDAVEDTADASESAPAVAKRGVRDLYSGTPPKPVASAARGNEFGRAQARLFTQEEAESTDSTNSRCALEFMHQ